MHKKNTPGHPTWSMNKTKLDLTKNQVTVGAEHLDVMGGFEPPFRVLQTRTSPLGHMTISLGKLLSSFASQI